MRVQCTPVLYVCETQRRRTLDLEFRVFSSRIKVRSKPVASLHYALEEAQRLESCQTLALVTSGYIICECEARVDQSSLTGTLAHGPHDVLDPVGHTLRSLSHIHAYQYISKMNLYVLLPDAVLRQCKGEFVAYYHFQALGGTRLAVKQRL